MSIVKSLVAVAFIIATPWHQGQAQTEVERRMELQSVQCLALNIYHEARNQSPKGQYAVALVTRNRVQDPRFPMSYCGVVKQGRINSWTQWTPARRKFECQFTWYCDGTRRTPRDMDAWGQAVEISYDVIFGKVKDFTKGATHYHTTQVRPKWRHELKRVLHIEDHIFYRWI